MRLAVANGFHFGTFDEMIHASNVWHFINVKLIYIQIENKFYEIISENQRINLSKLYKNQNAALVALIHKLFLCKNCSDNDYYITLWDLIIILINLYNETSFCFSHKCFVQKYCGSLIKVYTYIAIALITIYKICNQQPSARRYETGGAAGSLALVIMILANCNLVLFAIMTVTGSLCFLIILCFCLYFEGRFNVVPHDVHY